MLGNCFSENKDHFAKCLFKDNKKYYMYAFCGEKD
jgi:hypothetical protein